MENSITHSTPLPKGGSGRKFHRVTLDDGTSAVLCHYDDSREENALYADIASFLRALGFPVPRVLAHDATTGELLLEDAGDVDLHALRDAPWPERRAAYCHALDALHRLHTTGHARWLADGPDHVKLMPGFDAALYRWEREYFLENAVRRHAQIQLSVPEAHALETELNALAERLLALPPQLVHRDCQSQNILRHGGGVCFIDFQGMRAGTGFYDLGSLLHDPYVEFTPAQRDELLAHYQARGTPPGVSGAAFEQAFLDAAAQRLMQALGAYGFLGLVKGRPDFLAHTRPALANLLAVARQNTALSALRQLVERMAEK